ncbi:MAG: spore coat assembly protein-like protein [uncultured bacterium]|nr:MAG: spore coat assembly protein-like protein [uncultured bacterium]
MKTFLLKRHYKLILAFIAFIAFMVLLVTFLGSQQIIAYTNKQQIETELCVTCYENDIDIFDDTVVHEIQILTNDDTYDTMIETFKKTGGKEYFSVNVMIDGVLVENVGLRLKGNASLSTVLGGAMGGFGGGDRGGEDDGFAPPAFGKDGEMPDFEDFQFPEGFEPTQEFTDAMSGSGSMMDTFGDMGDGGKEDVPYLLKFDEFVEGQCYQSYAEIAVRTSGIMANASMLHEPITNYAISSLGIPISETSYAGVQLTQDSEPIMYVLAQQVDQIFIDEYFPDSDGVLYKISQVGNDFSYLGDDPTLYADIFSQETNINDADYTPLIKFMKFVTEASDEEFAENLSDYFDVVAFADYLVIHNMLANNDSLAGMGNNYYLYYDFGTEIFTILTWDTNESLGKLSGGMGGGGMFGGENGTGSVSGAETDIYWENSGDFGKFFEQFEEDSEGEEINDDFMLEMDDEKGDKMGMGSHLLKERFLETSDFLELYEERYKFIYEQLFETGILTEKVDEYSDMLTKYNFENELFDQNAYDDAVQVVLDFFEARYEYLQETKLLSGRCRSEE